MAFSPVSGVERLGELSNIPDSVLLREWIYETVIISDERISSPILDTYDVAVVLNQQSLDKFESSAFREVACIS